MSFLTPVISFIQNLWASIHSTRIPMQWYSVILLIVPALFSAMLYVIPEKRNRQDVKSGKPVKRDSISNNTLILILCQFLVSAIIYFIITLIVNILYSCFRSLTTHVAVSIIFGNYYPDYLRNNWLTYFLIPFLTAVVSKGVRSRKVRFVVCGLCLLVLLVTTVMTNYVTTRVYPMEFEILEELRRIGRPFETNIYDIESFKERCQNGYKVKSEVGDHGSESLPPVELKEDMHTLNLQQLLNCVYYLFYTDEERCLPYVDRSYELCTTTEQNDRFNVGEMWYYHAWFYDVEEYLNAAAEFIKAERYWNAAGAHWSHLNMSGWDDYRDFVECVVEAVNRGQAGNPLEYADNYCAWYSDDTSWDEENLIDTDESMLVRMLEPICEVATDELFLNTLLILNTIERDHREDVENLLALYPDCPKLLLLHQYYGAEELSRLYGLWIEHSDWFETEDRINLAWLYYDRGEYQMVRMITENAAEEVLIRAEAYMQNPEEADLVQLYNDISKTLGENISEVLYARLTVIRNLIGNKLGLPTDKGRMADACFSIFDADSSLGQFIIASLRNENGEYSVANKICDEVLNRITNTDPLYYRVLLLKSDVLMNLAGETDGDQQTQYYTDAIAILEGLRDSMETNYMMCLERLAEAYKAVGRDSDMQATIDVLNTLR